jgi:hypothetical protein
MHWLSPGQLLLLAVAIPVLIASLLAWGAEMNERSSAAPVREDTVSRPGAFSADYGVRSAADLTVEDGETYSIVAGGVLGSSFEGQSGRRRYGLPARAVERRARNGGDDRR